MDAENDVSLAADQALPLLQALAQWGPTTTVVVHGGCVFEFKGPFPPGAVAQGYYNLEGENPGFHGHIRLDAIAGIGFQEKAHRGRDSYAFSFHDGAGQVLFKVFLGRNEGGEVYPDQIEKFHSIRDRLAVAPAAGQNREK